MYPPSAVLRAAGFEPDLVGRALGLEDLDRPTLRPAPWWMRRIWARELGAMTLPWGIYVDPGLLPGDPRTLGPLVVHELVHLRQWRRDGVVRFLIRYLGPYLRARLRGVSHRAAYEAIPAEAEARSVTAALLGR